MVIGGATIYEQFLPYVDNMYLTIIKDPVLRECDCYFPSFNSEDFKVELLKEGNDKELHYKIKKYIRKK